MARQNITPNPSIKEFEAYMDFSGGLNSETGNEMLKDNEFPVLQNVDLASRGSAKRRSGRRKLTQVEGNGQGMFFYYREGQARPDIVFAVSGKLYVLIEGQGDPVPVKIIDDDGSEMTFQPDLRIEAVQYGVSMFIATGTKYLEFEFDDSPVWQPNTAYNVGDYVKSFGNIYKCTVAGTSSSAYVPPNAQSDDIVDGTAHWAYQWNEWHCAPVRPYQPTVMEAIYIGTNGLAENPDAYISDGESASLTCAGIQPGKRSGVVNQSMTFTAYVNKPASIETVLYKWEVKKSSDSTWPDTPAQDFSADAKQFSYVFDTATSWDIRLTIKDGTEGVQNPQTDQYALTSYPVNQVEDKTVNTERPVDAIQHCRKIRLHWDRILLSGDDKHPYQMYISDLNNPRYFPVSNTLTFDTGKQEAITSIVRFRDMLVIFTKTTIQVLTGKSPDDYNRSLIHDGLGCVADDTAVVTGNTITFLSSEGIYVLRPNTFQLEVMNVTRTDYPIKTEIRNSIAPNACAMVYDSQYWICFPDESTMYRLYYDQAMWVKDVSSKLNFIQMTHYGDDVYDMTADGTIYVHDNLIYNDDGDVYDMEVVSKFLDLGASFNWKKLKRIFILARHFNYDVNLAVYVQADSAIVLTPDVGEAVVQDGYCIWQVTTTPNFHFYAGTVLGAWILGQTPLGHTEISVQKAHIRGKARRVKVRFVHSDDGPCEIFGFGLEFKEKKPY